MAKTNVYKASYDDLSELTVNADSLQSAITELDKVRADVEPTIIRKIISNIELHPLKQKITVNVQAQMQNILIPLPDTIAVRPMAIDVEVGSMVQLYAIDTSTNPTVTFVGWYIGEECIGTTTTLGYIVPEETTEDITIVAKFDEV